MSTPSLAKIRSLPAPPFWLSSPEPPNIRSRPPLPTDVSLPSPPWMMSRPSPPWSCRRRSRRTCGRGSRGRRRSGRRPGSCRCRGRRRAGRRPGGRGSCRCPGRPRCGRGRPGRRACRRPGRRGCGRCLAAAHGVVARTAVDAVVAGAEVDLVVAAAAEDAVVAALGVHRVRERACRRRRSGASVPMNVPAIATAATASDIARREQRDDDASLTYLHLPASPSLKGVRSGSSDRSNIRGKPGVALPFAILAPSPYGGRSSVG